MQSCEYYKLLSGLETLAPEGRVTSFSESSHSSILHDFTFKIISNRCLSNMFQVVWF